MYTRSDVRLPRLAALLTLALLLQAASAGAQQAPSSGPTTTGHIDPDSVPSMHPATPAPPTGTAPEPTADSDATQAAPGDGQSGAGQAAGASTPATPVAKSQ